MISRHPPFISQTYNSAIQTLQNQTTAAKLSNAYIVYAWLVFMTIFGVVQLPCRLHNIVSYRIDVEDAGCEASKPSSLWNTSIQQNSNQFWHQGRFYGGQGSRGPQWKMWPPVPFPHFGPASLDFHLNRPVISLIQLQNTVISSIQLHIVAPGPPAGIVTPRPTGPHLDSASTARLTHISIKQVLFIW